MAAPAILLLVGFFTMGAAWREDRYEKKARKRKAAKEKIDVTVVGMENPFRDTEGSTAANGSASNNNGSRDDDIWKIPKRKKSLGEFLKSKKQQKQQKQKEEPTEEPPKKEKHDAPPVATYREPESDEHSAPPYAP